MPSQIDIKLRTDPTQPHPAPPTFTSKGADRVDTESPNRAPVHVKILTFINVCAQRGRGRGRKVEDNDVRRWRREEVKKSFGVVFIAPIYMYIRIQCISQAEGMEWGAGSRKGREGGKGKERGGEGKGRREEMRERGREGRGRGEEGNVVQGSLTNAPLLVAPNESVCTAGAALWSTLHAGQCAPHVAS